MGKKKGMGQIFSCCALMKSDESLQQFSTGTADFRAETCKSSLRVGEEGELCDKCVFPESKRIRSLTALWVHMCVEEREERRELLAICFFLSLLFLYHNVIVLL